MLSLGRAIIQVADPLIEVSVERVFKALINPDGAVPILINRLQFIRTVDLNQYRKMKTQLPYLVCGRFFPPARNKENFVFTQRFILDIDHFHDHGLNMEQIKEQLIKDENVELLFVSPGGDGLKVMFKLKERIADSGYYSTFYKIFCSYFAQKHHLGNSIDSKTHDVTRCCFVSYDPEAYYNLLAEPIDAALFLNPEGFTEPAKATQAIPSHQNLNSPENEKLKSNGKQELPLETLNLIKLKMGQKIKEPRIKFLEQREELDPIIERIRSLVAEVGAVVEKVTPISYGRQIKISTERHWSEINIFYGKKGLSIVGTLKSGSNKELCDGLLTLLKDYFF